MEALADATPAERARAVAAELARLQGANDSPETLRALAARQQQQAPARRLNAFLSAGDREFLSRATQPLGDRLPAAQTRACALPLQRAVALGDADRLRAELTRVLGGGGGSSPARVDNLRGADGETLLHAAVLHAQLRVAQTLLALGASPHTPLPPPLLPPRADVSASVSASAARVAAAPSSVAPRADNLRYSRVLAAGEATAVHYACFVGDLDMLKLLLAHDPRAGDARSSSSSSGGGSSSRRRDDAVARARPPLQGYREGSLLLWAIAGGHAHVAEFLLRAALERDCSDEDGNNAFGVAALLLGHDCAALRRVLRVLAAYGAELDVNHRNALGLTALDAAESPEARAALASLGARTARVVPVARVLRWDREAFRRDVRLCSRASRPRAAFLRTDSS